MSTHCSYSAIRIELKELEGKSAHKVYQYLKPFLGEAEDVSIDNGVVEDFDYGKKGRYRPVTNGKKWAIDIIISYEYDSTEMDVNLSSDKFTSLAAELLEKMKIKYLHRKFMSFVAYIWYNGSNEPIKIGEK